MVEGARLSTAPVVQDGGQGVKREGSQAERALGDGSSGCGAHCSRWQRARRGAPAVCCAPCDGRHRIAVQHVAVVLVPAALALDEEELHSLFCFGRRVGRGGGGRQDVLFLEASTGLAPQETGGMARLSLLPRAVTQRRAQMLAELPTPAQQCRRAVRRASKPASLQEVHLQGDPKQADERDSGHSRFGHPCRQGGRPAAA